MQFENFHFFHQFYLFLALKKFRKLLLTILKTITWYIIKNKLLKEIAYSRNFVILIKPYMHIEMTATLIILSLKFTDPVSLLYFNYLGIWKFNNGVHSYSLWFIEWINRYTNSVDADSSWPWHRNFTTSIRSDCIFWIPFYGLKIFRLYSAKKIKNFTTLIYIETRIWNHLPKIWKYNWNFPLFWMEII